MFVKQIPLLTYSDFFRFRGHGGAESVCRFSLISTALLSPAWCVVFTESPTNTGTRICDAAEHLATHFYRVAFPTETVLPEDILWIRHCPPNRGEDKPTRSLELLGLEWQERRSRSGEPGYTLRSSRPLRGLHPEHSYAMLVDAINKAADRAEIWCSDGGRRKMARINRGTAA